MDLNQFDYFFDAVAAFNNDGTIVYCNEAFSLVLSDPCAVLCSDAGRSAVPYSLRGTGSTDRAL